MFKWVTSEDPCFMVTFIAVTYTATYSVLIALGLYALYQSRLYLNKTSDDFISGKKHNTVRIMWSMYAASVGAWVSVAPSQFAVFSGYIGMMMYAISSALPILIVSVMSQYMTNVTSLNEFVGRRFGKYAQLFIICITFLNMGVALIAEYSTIGAIFQDVVHSSPVPTMLLIGLITMSYTSIGGIVVSIVTDQILAILTIALLLVTMFYIAFNFRPELPPLPEHLGPNFYGYSSILTMPASMISATVFSEAMWQRVYATNNKKSLFIAATISSILVFIIITFYGAVGFLANWANLINDDTNPNAYFFQIFENSHSWTVIIAVMIAAMMSQSAIDSLQNALAAALTANFFKGKSVWYARISVYVVNIPAILISLQMYPILNLFLMVNLLTTCCLGPLCFGLKFSKGYSQVMFLLSCWFGIIAVSGFGIVMEGTFRNGLMTAWFTNGYRYEYFLIALFMPIVSSLVFVKTCQVLVLKQKLIC